MSDLKLVYVSHTGDNWKYENLYEFIFSDDIKNVDGEDWDRVPASGIPGPPHTTFIKSIGLLKTDLTFDLAQDITCFSMYDAMDGVIKLAFENIDEYDEYPENRLVFGYGEDIQSVQNKLYEKDLILDIKKTNVYGIES